jgi:opacity protein-like surface antigen
MEAIMKLYRFFAIACGVLVMLVPPAQASAVKADAFFGYSRVGANLYAPNTPGMNGWQFAMHVKPLPFLGVEGDVSRYGADAGAGSQHATLVMFGPRVTAHGVGFSVFGHALGGFAHVSSTVVPLFPETSYNSTSYALGGGADIPLILGFKLRATGDYLGNSKAPSSEGSDAPQHFRIGVGVAYHF